MFPWYADFATASLNPVGVDESWHPPCPVVIGPQQVDRASGQDLWGQSCSQAVRPGKVTEIRWETMLAARTHTTNAMTTILLKQKWINAQKCYLFAFWEEFLLREQTLVGEFIEVIICWPGIFGIIIISHYKDDLYATNQYNGISLFCGNSIRRFWARFPRSLFAGHGVISGDSAVSPRWRYWKLLVLVMAAGIPGWSLGTL